MRLTEAELAEIYATLSRLESGGWQGVAFVQTEAARFASAIRRLLSAAADAETIRQAAVREFVQPIIAEYRAELEACKNGAELALGHSANALKRQAKEWEARIDFIERLAAARGVNLESEGGE